MAKVEAKAQVVELIEKMSVLELSELVKELEEKFGVKAGLQAGVPVSTQAPVSAEATKEEEQSEFDVVLKSFGENKIRVIKAVREFTELGLKEAKEIVDSAPSTVKEKVSKEEAESIKKKLEEVSAVCEIK